ncbi:hypothetical protein A2572_03715 [Candidatus Collierbacteria bacterium RIFOXYD1_FULL_40_9]|uniref:Uncharacterized protein n=1 Tax=Candidatus Collierbacteria bacterium RIFOXYD1_FULL_40_9 TaxID=1817731 RepID=A0A1F5FTE1_9BACT|nr:MAG: hypothetical protein A2572_03715 [Candidatus Collierbacteria bacterium RIFOXYD1_FULL_40_9]
MKMKVIIWGVAIAAIFFLITKEFYSDVYLYKFAGSGIGFIVGVVFGFFVELTKGTRLKK